MVLHVLPSALLQVYRTGWGLSSLYHEDPYTTFSSPDDAYHHLTLSLLSLPRHVPFSLSSFSRGPADRTSLRQACCRDRRCGH